MSVANTTPSHEKDLLASDLANAQMEPPGLEAGGPFKKHNSKKSWVRTKYDSPTFQVFLVAVVCFLTPGLYNALSGIGGGGQLDNSISEKASIALYSTFATVSFFAGSIHNKLGTRLTLWIGSLGYALYAASFLSYNLNQNAAFVVAAGAILGVCASLLWCSQGAIMMTYPTEQEKGKMIALFWAVFNLGAVIGSVIELGLAQNNEANTVNNGTYAAFFVLMSIGSCITWLLKKPADVVRNDGSRVMVPPQASWKHEIQGLFTILRTDPWIILLFPMFFASNFFYTWQFNSFNGSLFTLRTRALNSMLYWLAQMVGAFLLGILLDSTRLSRRRRACIGWAVCFGLVWAVWGGSYAKQRTYTRESVHEQGLGGFVRLDYRDGGRYAGLCILYIMSGVVDAVWQCLVYYLLGAVSNDLGKLAALAGFYKALQSAGAASAFGVDVSGSPYMTLLAVTWSLCVAGLLFAMPVIWLRIGDVTKEERTVLVSGAAAESKIRSSADEEDGEGMKGEGAVVLGPPRPLL
ncbi:unnamed protein product [Tilletia controversa]|uniref:MFS general substrate transporter n=3 Tax=Tilletia TaxID=13289 RepID=A0A8X7MYS2_9BASI|nr:hypothetical protein CF328_g2037 [Tilletia controversa]KAE8207040.1 hypothetical protein CF335_g1448 [Tilletia laevis]KAE8264000.1 hypothetical protein A4X03_0g1272 [Tilletia caries]KAE8252921.1 hypothetical protein A4X06_0g1825 [Tilletia controversa]CAD6892299.1 unnamed protein product [Tilletia caries]